MKSNLCFRNKNSGEMIRLRKRKLRQQLQPFEKIDFGQFCWFQMVERLCDYCCLLSALSLEILTRTKNYIFWGKMHLFLISKSILNLDPPSIFREHKASPIWNMKLEAKGKGTKVNQAMKLCMKNTRGMPLAVRPALGEKKRKTIKQQNGPRSNSIDFISARHSRLKAKLTLTLFSTGGCNDAFSSSG